MAEKGISRRRQARAPLRKIMKQKFQLGLFDNPYLNDEGLSIYNNEYNKNKGIEARM